MNHSLILLNFSCGGDQKNLCCITDCLQLKDINTHFITQHINIYLRSVLHVWLCEMCMKVLMISHGVKIWRTTEQNRKNEARGMNETTAAKNRILF